jgi:hypothetical protein
MTTLSYEFKESKPKEPFRIASYVGCHGPESPVVGVCYHELESIYEGIRREPLLGQFENALYYEKNSSSFNRLIPVEKKKEADAISREIFLKKIEIYTNKNNEITEKTIVRWGNYYHEQSPGFTSIRGSLWKGDQQTGRYSIGWHIYVAVEEENSPKFLDEDKKKYLPQYLTAYHEIQHVEDTPPRVTAESNHAKFNKHGTELKETLKTQILCDEVYKRVHDIGLYSEIDHDGKSISLNGNEIPLGKVLNFYRKLEESNGSLCEAILSPQSIEFLQKGGL